MIKFIKNHQYGFMIDVSGFFRNILLIISRIGEKCPVLLFSCPVMNECNSHCRNNPFTIADGLLRSLQ